MSPWGQMATNSAPTNFFRFGIAKLTLPTKRSLCAAVIGSPVGFLIGKRTLGMVQVKDRF